jgi:hypothetical protein
MTAKYVNIIRLDVPPEMEKETDEWYVKEHFPRLLSVPGVLSAKRYKLVEGDGPRYMTMFEIENPEVIHTEAYEKARDTPWSNKIRLQHKNRSRSVYRQIYP